MQMQMLKLQPQQMQPQQVQSHHHESRFSSRNAGPGEAPLLSEAMA